MCIGASISLHLYIRVIITLLSCHLTDLFNTSCGMHNYAYIYALNNHKPVHTHTYIHTYIHTCIHTYIHISISFTGLYVYMHIYIHVYIYMLVYLRVSVDVYVSTYLVCLGFFMLWEKRIRKKNKIFENSCCFLS